MAKTNSRTPQIGNFGAMQDPLMEFFYQAGVPVMSMREFGDRNFHTFGEDMKNAAGPAVPIVPTDPDPEKKPNPLRGMPSWYKHWFNTQGIYGGVKPSAKGLLDE